jgi:hypothetical protein
LLFSKKRNSFMRERRERDEAMKGAKERKEVDEG